MEQQPRIKPVGITEPKGLEVTTGITLDIPETLEGRTTTTKKAKELKAGDVFAHPGNLNEVFYAMRVELPEAPKTVGGVEMRDSTIHVETDDNRTMGINLEADVVVLEE